MGKIGNTKKCVYCGKSFKIKRISKPSDREEWGVE